MMTCVGRLIFFDLPVNSAGQNGSTIFGERLKDSGKEWKNKLLMVKGSIDPGVFFCQVSEPSTVFPCSAYHLEDRPW